MKIEVPDPPEIDPERELQRTNRLLELRALYDEAVLRLEAAKRRQTELQAALNQLQAEFNQTQQQVSPSQQNAAAKVAAADDLKPRLEELRAARDATTARLFGSVDTRQPILLLPVRLETRFARQSSNTPPTELLVRIYPDDVHIDTHEAALTADERSWGTEFQVQAAGGENAKRGAWRQLVKRFGIKRAAWIARVFTPGQPLSVGTRSNAWTRAPYSKVLPDRWVAIAYRGDQPAVTVWGKAISDILPTGPSPTPGSPSTLPPADNSLPVVDDGMRWMIDFKVAEGAGMALRLPLFGDQAIHGFERLIVLGIKSLDPANSAQRLSELLDAQHYTRGISLLPQNTPTNNTEHLPAGYGAADRDVEIAYSIELERALIGPIPGPTGRLDGHWLAWALGIPVTSFEHVQYADNTEQRDAQSMNRQLWPQDTPWLRRILVEGTVIGIAAFARDHFSSYVVARGPLPALRVGNQPYGVLPVTTFERICKRARPDVESIFLQRLYDLQGAWQRYDAEASSVTRGSDLVGLMEESGNSCRYVIQDFQNGAPQSPQEITIADLLPKLMTAANLNAWSPDVARPLAIESLDACSHRFDAWVTSLATRRLDELRRLNPSNIRLGGYGWLEDVRPTASWQPVPAPPGVIGQVFQSASNMGFVQAPSIAHATTAAVLRSGYLSHQGEGEGNPFAVDLSSDRVRRAEWLLQGVRQGQSLGTLLGYRFERRLHERGLDRHIARFRTLAGIRENHNLAKDYAKVREKEQPFNQVQILRTEAAQARALAGTYATQLAELTSQREQYQKVIDSYTLLQNNQGPAATATAAALANLTLYRSARLQSALQRKMVNKPGFGNVEIVERADLIEERDITNWNIRQSQLETSWQQAKADEASIQTKLANLRLDYVNAVEAVASLNDTNKPQSIPAIQTNQNQALIEARRFDDQATALEGGTIGKAEQDLAAARLALAQAINQQWQKSLDSVAANNVVDGLELRRRWRAARESSPPRWDATTIPFGNAALGFPVPTTVDFSQLDAQLLWLDEIVDAVGDLVLAESTYHLVQGNPSRSGATLDAIANGDTAPPETEVTRTLRTGVGLTHRMLVLFAATQSFAVPAWTTNANQVRALTEPMLNAWAARLLPDPAKVRCRVEYVERKTEKVLGTVDVPLTALQLSPLDVVYTTSTPQSPRRGELEERLVYYVARTQNVPANADIRLNYGRDPKSAPDSFSFGELVEVARTVRGLLASSRAIDNRDLVAPGETPDAGINVAELSNRVTAAQGTLDGVLTALRAALTAVRNSSSSALDALRGSLLRASAFGIAGSIPVAATDATTHARSDLIAQADSVTKEIGGRLERIRKMTLPAGSTPEAQRDYELERLRELLGADFRVVVSVTPQNATNLKQSFANSVSLQDNNVMESVTWFQRVACVRDGVARLHAALQYSEALGSGANLALQVGQLPYKVGDRWVALKGAIPSGRLSLVAHMPLPQAVSFDQPVAGLLVDEWNEMVPKASEVTGLTFHFDQPNACAPQALLLAVAPDDRPVWDLDTLQAVLLDTLKLARARAFAADGRVEVKWFAGRLPRGAQTHSTNWQWVTHDPKPLSNLPAHQSSLSVGWHQHYFSAATETLRLNVGDSLFVYAFLDPSNPPKEVMLQWHDVTNDGSNWEHRAFWGDNLIQTGNPDTASRRKMGRLPPLGQWVRLEVPAAFVGLEGREISGMAFTLWDGSVTWDCAGKITVQPVSADLADGRNETVWFEDRIPQSASLAARDDSWQWVSRNPAPLDGSFAHQSSVAAISHEHSFVVGGENVCIDDQVPAGAAAVGVGETWQWVTQNPAPLFGSRAHQSAIAAGQHQHSYNGASPTMRVMPGDMLFAHVYLDPNNPSREVMLQWNDGSWEHRAYWGENLIPLGIDGSNSRRFMGPLSPPGQWVRLEIPARLIGLEGRDVNGIAFTLWDGRATWDRAGTLPQQATLKVAKGDVLYCDAYLDPANPPSRVMLQWNDGSLEHRAYWSANPSGAGGTNNYHAGPLPATGQWIRLKVPANAVGLEGREVRGMAFILSNGRATWNRAGTLSGPLMPALFYAPGVI